jgi:hypothetical protein
MHDPNFVLFEVRRPIPRIRHWKKPLGKVPRFGVFSRVGHWEAYFPAVFVIWHREPKGADSGSICKHGPGSGLSVKALQWGWKHRRHLWIQNVPWQALNRRLWTRCVECGQPFRRKQSVHSHSWYGGGPGWRKPEKNVYHDGCSSLVHYRIQAEERLWMLDRLAKHEATLLGVSEDEVVQKWRAVGQFNGPDESNKAWRVTYAMTQSRGAHNDGEVSR